MRRIIIPAIAFTALPSSHAQELSIMGKPFSIMILVPFALIVISFLVALYLGLKQEKARIRAVLHQMGLAMLTASRYLEGTRLFYIIKKIKHIRLRRRLKKQPMEEEPVKYEDIEYFEELEKIEAGIHKSSPDVSLKRLSQLSRKFFMYNLNVNYEFTYEELAKAFAKHQQISDYSTRLSEISFGKEDATRNDVRQLAADFRKIVEKYWKKKKKKKAETIIGKIVEEDRKAIESITSFIDEVKHADRRRQLHHLLVEERAILSSDFRKVREAFRKILGVYLRLTPGERARIYPRLVEFCERIKEFPTMPQSKKEIDDFVKKLREVQHIPQRRTVADIIGEKYEKIAKGYEHVMGKGIEKGEESVKAKAKEELEYLAKVKDAVKKEERVVATKVADELDRLHEEQQHLSNKLHRILNKKKAQSVHEVMQKKTSGEIGRLLREGENVLERGNLQRSRIIYDSVKDLYTKLGWDERKKLSPEVLRFYKEIVKKIDSKKKQMQKK